MKKKYNNDGVGCGCIWWIVILALCAASVLYFYLIATSGLPDWLKYFLLK